MPDSSTRTRLIAVIAVVAVIWFLRASAAVTMPLAFALFFLILFDPLRARLADAMPHRVAVALTFLAAVAALAAFGWALGEAIDEAVVGLQDYGDEVASLRESVRQAVPFTLPSPDASAFEGPARTVLSSVWGVLGAIVLIYALLALGLAEVHHWRRKLEGRFSAPVSGTTVETVERIARQVQRFVLVQSATSVLTGILTGLFCWVLGVDLAIVWGVLAGVLNFVPTVGSIVAVIPPTLFALLQFGLGWEAPVVLLGLAAIQLVLGSYVDPKLQGRYLELSAFVVLVSITFWGWLWGIPGAFIAVPLTAALVVTLKEFDRTEWIARLLTRDDPPDVADA